MYLSMLASLRDEPFSLAGGRLPQRIQSALAARSEGLFDCEGQESPDAGMRLGKQIGDFTQLHRIARVRRDLQ